MADPAPGLAPQKQGPASISPEYMAGQESAKMEGLAAEEHKEISAKLAEAQTAQDATSARQRTFEDLIKNLKRPELPEQPKLQDTGQTSPVQAWTSSAMMLAAIGSLFTRRPLATAMKSAAAAINAFHDGDQARANAAFAKWKVDMDNYWKVADYQNEIYKETLGQYVDQEKIEADIGSQEVNMKVAEINALGHAFGDEMMAHAHSLEAIIKIMDENQRNNLAMLEHGKEIQISIGLQEALAAYDKEHGPPQTQADVDARNRFMGQTLTQDFNYQWTGPKITNWERQRETDAEKVGIVGNNWSSVTNKLNAIVASANALKTKGNLGSVEQTTLADAFTQIVNGGRAIRGFQMKMLTEQKDLVDHYMTIAQKVLGSPGGGGDLSPAQIADMIRIAKTIARETDSQMRSYVTNTIQSGKDAGIPEEDLKPTDIFKWYNDKLVPSMVGDNAPPRAIHDLWTHANDPTYIASYDKRFGEGASEEVLSGPKPADIP